MISISYNFYHLHKIHIIQSFNIQEPFQCKKNINKLPYYQNIILLHVDTTYKFHQITSIQEKLKFEPHPLQIQIF